MTGVVYDTETMQLMAYFEKATRARLKDCVVRDWLVVLVVEPGEMGKALGPKGRNVRRLESALKKRVRIVEFSPELVSFIKNMVHPVDVKVEEQDGVVLLVPPDLKSRGVLIGRNAQTLRLFEEVVRRFFPVKELRVAGYG